MTRDFPAGNLRVSDADRDAALAELSEHFQSGRITQDEFDERSGLALQARTGDDLRALFTDLPGPEAPGGRTPAGGTPGDLTPPPGPPARRPVCTPLRMRRGPRIAFIVIACVMVSIVVSQVANAVSQASGSHHVAVNMSWIVPVVILLIVLRRVGRR